MDEDQSSDDVHFHKGSIVAAVMVPVVLVLGIWLLVDFICYRRRKVAADKFRELHLHNPNDDGSAQDDNNKTAVMSSTGEENVAFSRPATHEATVHPEGRYSKVIQSDSLENSSNLRSDTESNPSCSRVTTTGAQKGEINSGLNHKIGDDLPQGVPTAASVNGHSEVRINGNSETSSSEHVELEMLPVTSSTSRQNSLPKAKQSNLNVCSSVSQA